MSVLLTCFFLAFASEMGDKTQVLALVLSTRFKRPWTVLAGIAAGALLNLALVAWLGGALSALVPPATLHWAVGLGFLACAAWMLLPEKEEAAGASAGGGMGIFWTTALATFLAEMGDKVQFAVLGLAAHYADPWRVTLGSVAGMVAADGLAVAFGGRLNAWLSPAWTRRAAGLLFAVFGLYLLLRP